MELQRLGGYSGIGTVSARENSTPERISPNTVMVMEHANHAADHYTTALEIYDNDLATK